MPACIKCKTSFKPTAEELTFLQKINLPEPSLCPSCRRQWRFAWRNERKLYHRTCDLTGKQIISVYAPDSPYKVYEQHEWQTDKWDGMESGKDFDFNRPFFEQFDELMKQTPKISMFASQNINSDYSNGAQQDKNCYMIFVSDHDEDCLYSYGIDSCKDCLECLNCYKCELCIECIDCSGSYNLRYCEQSHNCSDSFFLSDCKGCSNCFGCYGIKNKEYHIFNENNSKEDYLKKLADLNTGNRQSFMAAQKAFQSRVQTQQINQYYDGMNNQNVTGDHIVNCRNCIECYDSGDLEDCGYLIFSFKSKDCFDGHVVVDGCELCYGTISTIHQYNTQFTFVSFYSRDSLYLDHCQYCKNCFGCSALKHQEYCILNKQYPPEEYEKMKNKIIGHMKKTGEWGSPLPAALSPFGYNETVAQEFYPLSKEDALKQNFKWYDDVDAETSAYQGPVNQVPDNADQINEGLSKQIFICEKSNKPYKFIPQEIKLYKQFNVPLPKLCFDERHLARISRRNPRRLWKRNCQKCGCDLMSSYSPDRPETIYCEECYLQTVY